MLFNFENTITGGDWLYDANWSRQCSYLCCPRARDVSRLDAEACLRAPMILLSNLNDVFLGNFDPVRIVDF